MAPRSKATTAPATAPTGSVAVAEPPTEVTSPASTDAVKKPGRPAGSKMVTADNVVIEAIEAETDPNPFGREGGYTVPEDHALYKAFMKTYETTTTARVVTPEPEAVIKLLRKIASQTGLGVRVKKGLTKDGGQTVKFQGVKRRERKAKPAE